MQMGHRIRRLQWQVRSEGEDGFRLRQLLREEWQGQLVQYLQTEFDDVTDGDEIMHIPRLALHIRLHSDNDFPDAIAQQLRPQLHEQLAVSGSSMASPTRPNPALKIRPLAETQLVMLFEYLQQGHLAWPLIGDDVTTIRERCHEILHQHQAEIARRAFSVMRAEAFYFRLFQLLGPQTQTVLHEHWLPKYQTQRPLISCIVHELLPEQTRYIPHLALQLLARLVVSLAPEMAFSAYTELAHDLTAPAQQAWHDVLMRVALANDPLSSVLAAKPTAEPARRAPSASNSAMTPAIDADGDAAWAMASAELDPGRNSLLRNEAVRDKETELAALQYDIEPYLVHTAGLVLLHPYLSRLFAGIGLLADDNKTIKADKLPRAAALLHYLSTGSEEIYEFDLDLIKVMLGLHPTQAQLVGQGLLTEKDKQEAEILLQAVIRHWQVLKATSVQGLRQAFLRRSGLLRETEFNFVLQVERTGHDILLEHLPWGYSLIKLPWMAKALFTQW